MRDNIHTCPKGGAHCWCKGFKGPYYGDPPRQCCKCGAKKGGNPPPISYTLDGDKFD